MTEGEWLTATDPRPLLEYLRGVPSWRKVLLFACACCRRVMPPTLDRQGLGDVESAERHAEGQSTRVAYPDYFRRFSEGVGLGAPEAILLRCIFGNPFRPVTPPPTWFNPNVLALARAAYEERELPRGTLDRSRLAVLADALEDVGCRDGQVLGHLRGPGPHVRGCFVVDLLLGKQ